MGMTLGIHDMHTPAFTVRPKQQILKMQVRCPFCDRVTGFDAVNQPIVTDGSILWDTCEFCGKDISIDCIITTRNEEE